MAHHDKVVQYNYKIVIVGQSGVGKTNLLSRYVNDKFFIAQNATIGIQFTSKQVQIQDKNIKVQLWDTAGQERYRALASVFYKNSVGALVVFDLTNKMSFLSCKKWVQQIKQQSIYGIDIILIGNKSDLPNRLVNEQQARTFALQNEMQYFETSAASGENVGKSFECLIKKIYENQKKQEYNSSSKQNKKNEAKKPMKLQKESIKFEQSNNRRLKCCQ